MTDQTIYIDLDKPVHAPVGALSLLQILSQMNWPQGATCATQESDGEILYWDAPIEVVNLARQQAEEEGMIPIVGFRHQIHADYSDINQPILAHDWQTAVVCAPSY